jgi:hypothetical protein
MRTRCKHLHQRSSRPQCIDEESQTIFIGSLHPDLGLTEDGHIHTNVGLAPGRGQQGLHAIGAPVRREDDEVLLYTLENLSQSH